MAKLKDLSVSFLSLVKTPATGKGLTLKCNDPNARPCTFQITKTDDERMVAYGIVYAPDQEDSHGDTADAVTIRRAAYEFMREGRVENIDTEHSFNAEVAYVAESWLVRKGDAYFPDEPEGAWAVGIQIGDPDIWSQLKSGELTGISLAGIARHEPQPDDTLPARWTEKDAPKWVARLIKALTGADHTPTPDEETDMTKDEVEALVSETLKSALPGALTDALKSAGLGGTPAEPEPTEVEKAVAAALKEAGIEPKAKASDGDDKTDDPVKALTKSLGGKDLGTFIEDAVTKAVAKGADETGPLGSGTEESFA